MPITEKRRTKRMNYLGSSDCAAIVGRDPRHDRSWVYWSKIHTVEAENGTTGDAKDSGNRLEDALVTYASDRIGKPVKRNQFRVADNGIMASNLDAIVVGCNEGIEGKVRGADAADAFGEDGTDAVDEYTNLQCQHHMRVTGFDAIWVPVLLVKFHVDWRLYRVPRNQEIIDILTAEEVKFWHDHVLPRIPPSPEPPPMKMLRRLVRVPESVRMLDDEEAYAAMLAWQYRETCKRNKDESKAEYDKATAKCLQFLVDYDACQMPDGTQFRYMTEGAGARIDTKTLKINFPEAYAATASESTRRVLRIKQPKAKKD